MVMRKLDGELTQYRPTVNVLSTSKFMKKHREESLFYGRHSESNFEVYYHRAKRRDGGSTGFFGKVEKTESGSKIVGRFRKPVYAYVFAAAWAAVCLLCALGAYAAQSSAGAWVFLAAAVLGTALILADNNKVYIMGFLEEFPKVKEKQEDGSSK